MLHTEPLVRRSNRPRPIRTRERKIHVLETHPVNKKGVDDGTLPGRATRAA